MGLLDRFKKSTVDQTISVSPDPRGAPGTRVYHEYFVDPEPTDGRWRWHCRVYGADGKPIETTGSEETEHAARAAAVVWAEATKATMRGAA